MHVSSWHASHLKMRSIRTAIKDAATCLTSTVVLCLPTHSIYAFLSPHAFDCVFADIVQQAQVAAAFPLENSPLHFFV